MKLRTSYQRVPALVVTRNAIESTQLVYIGRASRELRYPLGKSAIVYIGTTKNGLVRIAGSAAWKADHLLSKFGVKSICYNIVTCAPKGGVKTWRLLERALIIRFRETFGSVPQGNDAFKNAKRGKEFTYFSQARLDKILAAFSESLSIEWD